MEILKSTIKSLIVSSNYLFWQLSGSANKNQALVKSVLIVDDGFIGDLLATTPLIRHLHSNRISVDVLIRRDMKILFKNNKSVKNIFELNSTISNRQNALKKYDSILVISLKETSLLKLLKQRTNLLIGYLPRNTFQIKSVYDQIIFEPLERHNKVVSIMQFSKSLGINKDKITPETDPLELKIGRYSKCKFDTRGNFAILSSSSRNQSQIGIRMIGPKKWAEVVKYLNSHYGFKIFLVGTKKEKEACRQIYANVNDKVNIKDLSGKTSLLELIYLIKKAKIVVGIDSGTMHIAASQDIPAVDVIRESKLKIWSPWAKKNSYITLKAKDTNLDSVSVKEITDAIDYLIKKQVKK